jgi:hypothetical protein
MRALFESGHHVPVLCRYGTSPADGKRAVPKPEPRWSINEPLTIKAPRN